MSSHKHRQISPKSTIDTYSPYTYNDESSPISSSSSTSTSKPFPITTQDEPSTYDNDNNQNSTSSSRRSSSNSTSSFSKSSSSQSSLDLDEKSYPDSILPTYNSSFGTTEYFKEKLTRRSSSIFSETTLSTKNKISNKFRQRRRSSIPFIHLARRKSTQIIIGILTLIFGLLLISEIKSNKLKKELWLKEIKLNEWDLRFSSLTTNNNIETNLNKFRKDFEFNKRSELLNARQKNQYNKRSKGEDEEEIWGPKDEVSLKIESSNKWPNWWGNPDLVGKSPFDHSPLSLPVGEEKRRLMFLTDYSDYLERMNTHTYEIVDAALRHPQIIVDVWGPGWDGYDKSIPLSANIRKRSYRLEQLEQSKKKFELNQQQKKAELDKENRLKNKQEWYSRRLEVTRPPLENMDGDTAEEEKEKWVKPDWNEEVPESCNINVKFDMVFTISNIFNENDPHVDALDCGALLVQQLGDCHELRCSFEWYPHANNITVSKYAFELLELFEYDKVKSKYPDWQMGLFGHSPDTGNEWDFYPIPWVEKNAKAKVFGYDGSFYPIRTTVTDSLRIIEREPGLLQDSIITRHPHPGYTVSAPSVAREKPLETYELNHEYYENHLKLREDFANGMRTSKICVFDSSLERKMIRKYAQAFLSGCVVASDLPTEHEEALSKFVIPLKSTWNIEKINEVLNYYLDRDDLLQQMAMDGFIWARQHMTTTNKISHLLKMSDHYRSGSRGYEFPYGFSMRCRSYWSGDAYRPPWCPQEGYRGLEE